MIKETILGIVILVACFTAGFVSGNVAQKETACWVALHSPTGYIAFSTCSGDIKIHDVVKPTRE